MLVAGAAGRAPRAPPGQAAAAATNYTIVHDLIIGRKKKTDHTRSSFGRGDDAIGNPHRAQIFRFKFFELILLLKLDKRPPVEQFEALLYRHIRCICICIYRICIYRYRICIYIYIYIYVYI